jgi:hypothetical protein
MQRLRVQMGIALEASEGAKSVLAEQIVGVKSLHNPRLSKKPLPAVNPPTRKGL